MRSPPPHTRMVTCGAASHNEAALSLLMAREGKIKRYFMLFNLISPSLNHISMTPFSFS